MQAVEINAALPNEPEKVQKPKKADTTTETRSFLDMIKKLALNKTADEPSVDAEVGANSLDEVELELENLGSKDFDAKLKSTKTTECKKGLDVASVLKSNKVKGDSKVEKDSNALDFEKKAELMINSDEEVDVDSLFESVVDNAEESESAVLLSSSKDLEQSTNDGKKAKGKSLVERAESTSDINELQIANQKAKATVDSKRNRGGKEADEKGSDELLVDRKKKSKTKSLFTVEDLRSGQVNSEQANVGVHSTGTEERTSTDNSAVDFTITIPKGTEKSDGVFFNGSEAREAGSSQASQSFTELLSRELSGMNDDFMRAGKIILRDNNAGSIRLNLQPEKLGNVKIFLELSEGKKVVGKIVVASEEAYNAFQENMEGLVSSFESGGFESAGFDLTWAGSGQNSGFAEQGQSFGKPVAYEDSLQELMVKEAFADNGTYGFGQAETIDVLA